MTLCCIGLGGNTAGAAQHLTRARKLLKQVPGARFVSASAMYASAPVGCPGRQREYLNCAVLLQTASSPRRIFMHLRKTEQQIQKRRRKQNAPRRVDVDYLMHGNAKLTGRLNLPHPRMHLRAFVLLPLADILGPQYESAPDPSRLRAARRQCQTQTLRRVQ